MKILWIYLQPYRWLILLSLVLAAAAQLLNLVDPIIFGMIIDDYALELDTRSESELISGVLRLLAIAVAVSLLSRLAKALREYAVRLVVQKFGVQILGLGCRTSGREQARQACEHDLSSYQLAFLENSFLDTRQFTSDTQVP